MPKFRIEITEITTITREQWFDAPTAEEAKHQAEADDWREWQEVGIHHNSGVTLIENAETGEEITLG